METQIAEMNSLTIHAKLVRLGYGHRRDHTTENDGRHIIYRISDGKIMGRFDVFEAIKFIKAAPPARDLWLDIHE